MKKTVIIGATPNPTRYAYIAAERLKHYNQDYIPVGIKKGHLFGKEILDLRKHPAIEDVHTITLYINQAHQQQWEDYILSLKPKRIIFNPGAENPELAEKARAQGAVTENACTLVMLGSGVF